MIGHFPDKYQLTLKGMYAQKGWSRESVYRFVAETYRACRPDVVVTQDVNGEYGHGAHRAAADAECVLSAANQNWNLTSRPLKARHWRHSRTELFTSNAILNARVISRYKFSQTNTATAFISVNANVLFSVATKSCSKRHPRRC